MDDNLTSPDIHPIDKWLPGCYKGNKNKVREACFCIPSSSEQLRSHYTNNSGCTRAHMQSSPHLHTFHHCVCQTGSQNSPCTPETWAQTVPCIQKPWYPLDKWSLIEGNPLHAPTQTPILFLYARRSDVVVNAFRWYVGYGDANKHVSACVCW